jgi:hypothetical protein
MIPLLIAVALLAQERGVEMKLAEGTVRAFPEILDENGQQIGTASVAQWVKGSQLHVRSEAKLKDGRTIIERATFERGDRLMQLNWSWEERLRSHVKRKFAVDMTTGMALVIKDGRRSERRLKGTDGAFAGLGFAFAVRNLHERLQQGEEIELVAVGFTPKPRVSKVVLSAVDDKIDGVSAQRVTIRAKLPKFLLDVLRVPDQTVWISKPSPPALLRAKTSLGEPSDPMVTIDAM